MKIGIIQVKVEPDIQKNIEFVKNKTKDCVHQGAEVIVWPEIWNTPYYNDAILHSVKFHKACYECMKELSAQYKILLIGGTIACPREEHIYNTCHIFEDGKEICTYDKMHLFEVTTPKGVHYTEKEVFDPGQYIKTFTSKHGKFGILVCYDLRFCEVARLLAMKGATALFCPSAFNQSVGKTHWQPLIQTRAMENEVFLIGASPQEYSYKTFTSYGHSMIADPFGKIILDAEQKDSIVCDINLDQVEKIRKQMPFWQIRRTDIYRLEENTNERNQD